MTPEPSAAAAERRDESLGTLVGEMTSEVTTLLRKEVELARIEIKDEVARTAKAGQALGAAAACAYLAAVLLAFAAAWGLDAVLPTGVAFLIVGAVFAVAAVVLGRTGRDRVKQLQPVPEQTVATLKEDVEWAKAQTK